ncbi:unnamed protein product [Peniophora sp. CBMAI 1063]|nr:unnamed protein product [Peniophora sp. CBMAI 1063]
MTTSTALTTHASVERTAHSTSIANLPYDVLCELYHTAAIFDPPRGPRQGLDDHYCSRPSTFPGDLGWIKLTHVSRHWREVGLGLSALWAGIVCAFPPTIEDILLRAGSTPVAAVLEQDAVTSAYRWSYDDIGRILPRARSLEIDFLYNHRKYDVQGPWCRLSMAGQTLPSVERMRVLDSGVVYQDGHVLRYFGHAPALHTPSLRALSIDLPWPIHAPSLRSLCIHRYAIQWPWQVLLNFIKSFPLLEQLEFLIITDDTIKNSLLGRSRAAYRMDEESLALNAMRRHVDPPSVVHLPYLKRLVCQQDGCAILELMDHLDYPATTIVKIIDCKYDLPGFFESIISRPGFNHAPLDHLTISSVTGEAWETTHSVVRTVWATGQPCLSEQHVSDERSSIAMRNSSFGNLLNRMKKTAVLPPSELRGLALSHDCTCVEYPGIQCRGIAEIAGEYRLTMFLRRCVNVATLYLHHQGQISSNTAIILLAPIDEPTILPALRTLDIHVDEVYVKTWWTDLRAILEARRDAKCPITRLIIRGPGACHTSNCPGHEGLVMKDEYAGWDLDEEVSTCLERRQIHLEAEEFFVEELIDARDDWVYLCECEEHCYSSCDLH